MVGEQRQVFATLAQWRDAQGVDVEAVEEVGAEAAGGHLPLEVAVGGGEQADIDLAGATTAQLLHLAALQYPQQLGLHRQGQLADLVEEQGGAVGKLELAGALLAGAGKGAAHVAEELALGQGFDEVGAVHRQQGLLVARRGGMDGKRRQLLANARLAGDQH